MRNGMPELLCQIADDEQANAELVANANNIPAHFVEEREFQQDHLGNAVSSDNLFELIGSAEDGNSVLCFVDVFVANQTDRAQTDLSFSPQPAPKLGRFAG